MAPIGPGWSCWPSPGFLAGLSVPPALGQAPHPFLPSRTIGDRMGEAKASGNLGNTLKVLGRFDEAVVCCQRHLDIAQEQGDKVGQRSRAEAWPPIFQWALPLTELPQICQQPWSLLLGSGGTLGSIAAGVEQPGTPPLTGHLTLLLCV